MFNPWYPYVPKFCGRCKKEIKPGAIATENADGSHYCVDCTATTNSCEVKTNICEHDFVFSSISKKDWCRKCGDYKQ